MALSNLSSEIIVRHPRVTVVVKWRRAADRARRRRLLRKGVALPTALPPPPPLPRTDGAARATGCPPCDVRAVRRPVGGAAAARP